MFSCSPFWLACRSPCDHCEHSSAGILDTLLSPACTAVPWNRDGQNTPKPRSPHGWSSPCSWNLGPGSYHILQTPPASCLWSTSPRRTLSVRRWRVVKCFSDLTYWGFCFSCNHWWCNRLCETETTTEFTVWDSLISITLWTLSICWSFPGIWLRANLS